MNKNLRNKKVLITGSSGFIGSHLWNKLIKSRAHVVGISKKPVRKGEIRGDVTNFTFVDRVIKKYKIQTIFHLASQPIVDIGVSSPRKTLETNIRGTWNILEAARLNQVRRVIVASTAHVYGDSANNSPFRETACLEATRPYETSKVCSDLLAQSYRTTYPLSIFIPRFVNIYGPGDENFSRIVPKTMKATIKNKNPEIWGGKAVRDFLFIDDAIAAYLLLAKKADDLKDSGIYNFGVGKPINVVDLAKLIIALSDNKNLEVLVTPSNREKEIKIQYVSFQKAKKNLGWKAKVSLKEGLKKTWQWYKKLLTT